jgi:hypothetical protein
MSCKMTRLTCLILFGKTNRSSMGKKAEKVEQKLVVLEGLVNSVERLLKRRTMILEAWIVDKAIQGFEERKRLEF